MKLIERLQSAVEPFGWTAHDDLRHAAALLEAGEKLRVVAEKIASMEYQLPNGYMSIPRHMSIDIFGLCQVALAAYDKAKEDADEAG